MYWTLTLVLACCGLWLLYKLVLRIQLSLAKHRSLLGHSRWAKRIARWVPATHYLDEQFYGCDQAPREICQQRQVAFQRLVEFFAQRQPQSAELGDSLRKGLSDAQLLERNQVPYQFQRHFNQHIKWALMMQSTSGVKLQDLDGIQYYDLAASYGVNVLGYDCYKELMQQATHQASELGPLLGPHYSLLNDNVERLRSVSGLDEVSFHMSGTEAVMQAVRLARYNSGRTHLVRFCGAYNGWWDDAQPGIGNPTNPANVYTLAEMSRATLRVLATRRDIACVLVNPIQAMHPNRNAPGDAMLMAGDRSVYFDRAAYSKWLQDLREVCTRRNIALIFDEVFVGFRIALGGAQQYFGVQADLVTYGKTLGGGYPVGVVCGKAKWMRRYDDQCPSNICFARGTFNAHPYVMAAMDEFLRRLEDKVVQRQYQDLSLVWDVRAQTFNQYMADKGLPLRCVNMVSVFVLIDSTPSRYNWMLQVYMRAEGLYLGLPGTGRLIFSHNYTDDDFEEVIQRIARAAEKMREDGWWWHAPEQRNKDIRRHLALELLGNRLGFSV